MKKIHTHHALGVIIVKVRRDETMWGSTWKESGVFVYVIVRMQKYVFVGVGWCVYVCVCVCFVLGAAPARIVVWWLRRRGGLRMRKHQTTAPREPQRQS